MIALVAFAAIAIVGTVVGLALFPYSDLVVLGVAVAGGVALGRALPARFRPVLILLVVPSVIDLLQVAAFAGPPTSSRATPAASPDPHLIWLNFRLLLPDGGHFNIGLADLLLVVALAENFRRSRDPWPVAAMPGAVGLSAGTLIASIPFVQAFALGACSQALVPYLTAGWLVVLIRPRTAAPEASAFPAIRGR